MTKPIQVIEGSVINYGSCNGCHAKPDPIVVIVLSERIEFRLCDACLKMLVSKLKDVAAK